MAFGEIAAPQRYRAAMAAWRHYIIVDEVDALPPALAQAPLEQHRRLLQRQLAWKICRKTTLPGARKRLAVGKTAVKGCLLVRSEASR